MTSSKSINISFLEILFVMILDLKRWDNPSTDSIELYFYIEYGSKVTDEDAIALLVGLGSTTAK